MGVLSGKDIFSSKWITAEITDSSNHIWYVPIKTVIGDYFLAEIEKQIYCFKIDGSRVKTYRHTLVKSFRILQYDTNHYLPVDAKHNTELEDILRENSLPKVNSKLLGVFKVLGNKEKNLKKGEEFTPHRLKEVVDEMIKQGPQYAEQAKNLENYLNSLSVDQIVRPVRKISEFLDDDLLTTDPRFLGTIFSAYQRTEIEHKKMTNVPEKGKTAWVKIIAIVAIIGLLGGIGYMVYSSGMLENLIPHIGAPAASSNDLMKQYPTPEAMKAAIDRGELSYNSLSPDLKKAVDHVKTPVATPKP